MGGLRATHGLAPGGHREQSQPARGRACQVQADEPSPQAWPHARVLRGPHPAKLETGRGPRAQEHLHRGCAGRSWHIASPRPQGSAHTADPSSRKPPGSNSLPNTPGGDPECHGGEVSGLQWDDIDTDAHPGYLRIKRTLLEAGGRVWQDTPKSKTTARVVPLDGETVRVLREHRKAQLAERLAAGSAYEPGNWVIADEIGRPTGPT